MQFTLTIVDRNTRKPIEGTISYYRGLQKARGYTTVGKGGVSVDIPSDITQVQVGADGYYDYTTRVDSLYDTTEFQLDKKASILNHILLGAGLVLAYQWVKNRN